MEFLENHRRAFLLSGIGICVIAIILTISPGIGSNIVSGGLSYVVTPMQSGLNSAVSWVSGNFSAIANNQHLIVQNRELQAEINRLEFENHRLSLAAEENAMLNAALNMHQQYSHLPTMGARVIAQDPNNWYRSFRIDRGANDGVEPWMPIIADGGLAGVVRYVNPTSSQFVSVLDSRFYAAVTASRTDDFGIATGDISLMQQGLLRMNHIEAHAQIMPGDEILTSTDSSVFPAGLLLGEVQSIHTNPDGLTRHAIIRPAANLANLEMVLVINQVFSDGQTIRDMRRDAE
ncbi:MAG: rod shape-determining protein MreC [Defluviitaleaceae bacterium]|nr:rod shape-determining protein MreC [Defluviitaleaceae bacterium]MCL2262901.1 rod shape-determining protein MreC [Defluviitaleaceae bacterium]